MYAVYKQTHPPTGLEFSLYCHFFSAAERNLVVAGTSQLFVYRLNHEPEAPGKGDRNGEGKGQREKLELLGSFSFFGNVMSMASVQLAGAKRDALLLSFKDAKLSVVEYDPGTHDLKTLSLHYFEEPELRDGFVQNVHTPCVRVDPDGRCAVMLIYGTRLVVLPFRRDSLADEHEGLVGEGQKSSFLPSYIIDVRELDEKLLNIIDMQFLHGYYEPTLLILFEPNQTWPGRVAVRQDTCSIVAISLNILQRVHPVIWSLSSLPFDCTQALPVPKPIGHLTCGTTVFPLRIQEGVRMTLDCAQATFISYDKMVISLKGGEIYVLTLITDGMRSVRSFLDQAPRAHHLWGTLRYTEKLQEPPAGAGKEGPDRQEEPPVKKKRSEPSGAVGGKPQAQDEVDEIEVYGSEAASGTQLATYSFEVCDSILNIGPCANAAMGEPAFLSEEFQNSPEPDLEIVLCSGYGKNGALTVLQRSIRPQVVTTFELPGCYDMWTVTAPSPREQVGLCHRVTCVTPCVTPCVTVSHCLTQLHFVPVDLGSPIVHCAVADPFGVLLSADGHLATFTLKGDTYGGRAPRLALLRPPVSHPSRVTALCLYRDLSGMFTTESRAPVRSPRPAPTSGSVDDEEEMLYGDSGGSGRSRPREEPRRAGPPERDPAPLSPDPSHWCVLARENGNMEIYQVPEWRLVFLVKNFPVGQRVLVDSSFGQPPAEPRKDERGERELPHVRELLLGLGRAQSRPFLLVHVEQELLLYEAFAHDSQLGQSNLKVRFRKVPHGINFREKKPKPSRKKPEGPGAAPGGAPGGTPEEPGPRGRVARRPFHDIYGYSGVFICGPSPHWVLLTGRGALRLHPMGIDGPVESFEPLSTTSTAPRGFLYFNRQGELRISVLPAYLSYDAPWPVRKIPLRCTAHYVAYHVESKVYAVATSSPHPCTRIPRMTGEEKEFESIERDERYVPPQQEAFSIQLISPVSWEVAVGTCLMQGEEVTCRGRILILDVIEVVPEPGQPLTKNKFKVLYEKEQKGPVTALCHCHGYLVSAIGQKIFLWSLKDNELTGMAFIDTQLYIHQMISVKSFILAADLMKSISLLRYQEESKTLSLVSRDAKPLEVYSVDFMVDGSQLGFLELSDRERNLLVYMYLPEAKESFGGLRLLRRADFHVGAHVNTFWRTPCRGHAEGPNRRSSTWENKHITWFGRDEKTYRRLLMLQNASPHSALPHLASLNPRAFRLLQSERRLLQNAVRNVLDGELLGRYLYLSAMERAELAKKIGTTPEIILDDLLEIDRVTAHF
uniref:Cleavage and polyadenylation specificity factor subunit 1 n=1 Tax=Geospiza parvula TaxID=87175 RepID=A0A8C3MBX0_GEOPR